MKYLKSKEIGLRAMSHEPQGSLRSRLRLQASALGEKGQMVVMLLVFMSVTMTLTTSAITVAISSVQASSKYSIGQVAYTAAESGAEDAVMRVMRNNGFTTAGTSLAVSNATATYTVTGAFPGTKTITSVGTYAAARRTIEVKLDLVSNAIQITSWKEI